MGRRRDPKPRRVTVIRYYGPDGKRCKRTDPGAVRKKERSETYYLELPPKERGGKKERTSLGTGDLNAAWKRLREVLVERAKVDAGLAGPEILHATRPIAEHVADWVAQLRAAGRTGEDQVRLVESRVSKLVELAGWERLPQVNRDSALKALQRVQAERSAQTRNHYLRHLKQFLTWCVNEDRLSRSPVSGMAPVNVEVDQRHPRRSPGEGEVGRLMAYLEGPAAVVRCRMPGPQRALGYRVCMATGFRADELRSLSRESFDLDAANVTVRAAHSKHRREDVQHLPAWLVDELRAWFAAGGGCWSDFPASWPGRLLKADQEAAGIEHRTDAGFFDFHSWRKWYVTWAANLPDVSPKTLMEMCRHSDPRLTLKVYAGSKRAEVKRAVESMPRPGSGPANP